MELADSPLAQMNLPRFLTTSAPIDLSTCFSESYAGARDRFLAEARAVGATLRAFDSGLVGPEGETLSTDAAWLGNKDASRVMVLVSGTHGVEGFSGSGAQIDFLRLGVALPEDVAVLLVHALNPYGFAYLRRTTEEGVDLNRNGLDFSKPLPANPGFDQLRDALLPRELEGPVFEAAEAEIAAFKSAHGEKAFETARSAGQYVDPLHFFYGGTGPTRAMGVLEEICRVYELASRQSVAIIDYHTGLGPYGYGEPICGHAPGTSGQQRCRAWYGKSLGEPQLGSSSSVVIPGLTQYAWERQIGPEVMTFIALEFGTYDRTAGRRVLRLDHWLHAYGSFDWNDSQTQTIKREIKHHYYPATDDWNESVILRSRQVLGQTLRGLLS